MTHKERYEQFIHEEGWRYKTDEALMAAYNRLCKPGNGELLTEEEFVQEAATWADAEAAAKLYAIVAELAAQERLDAWDVYRYAHHGWCVKCPEAVVAYEVEQQGKWVVNNCPRVVTEHEAIVRINGEWGFEASRIEIIGTPYYDATDYQFMRFDCAHMTWLWANGNLYGVIV